MTRIERIFNGYALLALNVGLVIACFTVGDGEYFHRSGLVHLFALGFILLASSRLWTRKFLTDRALQSVVQATMFAMLIFSISHVAEFAGYKLLHQTEDATFSQVVNLYTVSLLALVIGCDYLIGVGSKSRGTKIGAWAGIVVALSLSLYTILHDSAVSLDVNHSVIPWLYVFVVFTVTVAALLTLAKLRKRVTVLAPFVSDIMLACALIMLATLPNIFFTGLEDNLGLSAHTIVYLSHFGFYFALSMLFLAFPKLRALGGVFDEVAAMKETT